MAVDSSNKLTKYTSAVTIVTDEFMNKLYGGLYGTVEGSLLGATDPRVAGHVHDGVHIDGHAQKIDLVNHVTGQLQHANLADVAVRKRNVERFTTQSQAIPEFEIVGPNTYYKLDLSSLRSTLDKKTAFITVSPTAGQGEYTDIQSAVTAAPLAGRTFILLKDGTYTLTSSVTVSAPNKDITFIGSESAIVRKPLNLSAFNITSSGAEVTFEGFTISYAAGAESTNAPFIQASAVNGFHVNKMHFQGNGNDTSSVITLTGSCSNFWISDSLFSNTFGGILLSGVTRGVVKNNRILQSSGASNISLVGACNDIVISGNAFQDSFIDGIHIETTTAGSPENIRVVDNTIISSTDNGIRYLRTSGALTATNHLITGNIIKNCPVALNIFATLKLSFSNNIGYSITTQAIIADSSDEIVITGNTLEKTAIDAVNDPGILIEDCEQVLISTNIINKFYEGIRTAGTSINVLIQGNKISECDSTGGSSNGTGVVITGNSESIRVENNIFKDMQDRFVLIDSEEPGGFIFRGNQCNSSESGIQGLVKISNSSNWEIVDNVFTGSWTATDASMAWLDRVGTGKINGNTMEGDGSTTNVAILVYASTSLGSISDIEICNNKLENFGQGIKLDGTNTSFRGIRIENNRLHNFNSTTEPIIEVDAAKTTVINRDISIVGNIITDSDGSGISVIKSGTLNDTNHLQELTISDNKIRGLTLHGIEVSKCSRVSIIGNIVIQCGATPDSFGDKSTGTAVGIYIYNITSADNEQANSYVLSGNVCNGNTDGIRIENLYRVSISACEAHNNTTGLRIEGCDDINISGCQLSSNSLNGLEIDNSDAINATACNLTDNFIGLDIANACHQLLISACKISDNGDDGISCDDTKHLGLIFSGCNVSSNVGNGFDLNTAGTNGERLSIIGCITYINTGNGINIVGWSDVNISGCQTIDSGADGILISGTDHTGIVGSSIRSSAGQGICIIGASEFIKIADCEISNNASDGIQIDNATGKNFYTITGNVIHNNGDRGIQRVAGGSQVLRWTVSNNVLYSNGSAGIALDEMGNVIISGNSISNETFDGIYLNNVNRVSMIGNIITNCGDEGIDLNGTCEDFTITGNVVYSNTGYGVEIGGSCDDGQVTGNRISDNTAGQIQPAAAAGNIFYSSNNIIA